MRVVFICSGNICRSPLAEGVFRAAVARRGVEASFEIDSCGTGGWHVGESPDRRSVAVARRHGVDISQQRARQLQASDFDDFDWLVAMDRSNERTILQRQKAGARARVVRVLDLDPGAAVPDVPDPYYGGPGGFDDVYDLLESACEHLLEHTLAHGGQG